MIKITICILLLAIILSSCSSGDSIEGIIPATNNIEQSKAENPEDLVGSALDEIDDAQSKVPLLEFKFNDISFKVEFEHNNYSGNPKAKMRSALEKEVNGISGKMKCQMSGF